MQRDSFLRSRGRNEIFVPARSVDVTLGTSFESLCLRYPPASPQRDCKVEIYCKSACVKSRSGDECWPIQVYVTTPS